MAVVAGTLELAGAVLGRAGPAQPARPRDRDRHDVVAASVNVPNGLWAHLGGYEVAFVYAGLAAVLAYTGPGRYSLDQALGKPAPGPGWSVVAVVVGVAAAIPMLLRRRAALRSRPEEVTS